MSSNSLVHSVSHDSHVGKYVIDLIIIAVVIGAGFILYMIASPFFKTMSAAYNVFNALASTFENVLNSCFGGGKKWSWWCLLAYAGILTVVAPFLYGVCKGLSNISAGNSDAVKQAAFESGSSISECAKESANWLSDNLEDINKKLDETITQDDKPLTEAQKKLARDSAMNERQKQVAEEVAKKNGKPVTKEMQENMASAVESTRSFLIEKAVRDGMSDKDAKEAADIGEAIAGE